MINSMDPSEVENLYADEIEKNQWKQVGIAC